MKSSVAIRVFHLLILLVLVYPTRGIGQSILTNNGVMYVTNGVTLTVVRYTGTNHEIIVPDKIGTLPVTRIGTRSFLGCTNLVRVTIPESITRIEEKAFASCISLKLVNLPNHPYLCDGYVFQNCLSLEEISLPKNYRGISEGMFAGCSSLRRVDLPDGLLTIQASAFNGCVQLSDIEIPASVTEVEEWAFYNCSSLHTVRVPENVASYAFSRCTSLTNVLLPNSVLNIGVGAFGSCNSLVAFEVDPNNQRFSSFEGVLFDKSRTSLLRFPPSNRTGGYQIPSGVTSIANWAFENANLTDVILPSNHVSIGESAFWGCSNLTEVSFGNGVISVGNWAFTWCQSLTNVALPSTLTNLGGAAFYKCTSLREATIGRGVTKIGNAFWGCSSLRAIYFEGDAPAHDESGIVDRWGTTVYYLPGTRGWGAVYGGSPTAPWFRPHPLILSFGPKFGVSSDEFGPIVSMPFGFIISWATNSTVIVEASDYSKNGSWAPVGTNVLVDGWAYFGDPKWSEGPGRTYRIRAQ